MTVKLKSVESGTAYTYIWTFTSTGTTTSYKKISAENSAYFSGYALLQIAKKNLPLQQIIGWGKPLLPSPLFAIHLLQDLTCLLWGFLPPQ